MPIIIPFVYSSSEGREEVTPIVGATGVDYYRLSYERLTMVLGCHGSHPLSSLAFGRGWHTLPKLFFFKGFATQKDAGLSSGSAVTAIEDIVIAATVAVGKPGVSSGELPTVVISRVRKEDWIIGIVNELIGNGWQEPA